LKSVYLTDLMDEIVALTSYEFVTAYSTRIDVGL